MNKISLITGGAIFLLLCMVLGSTCTLVGPKEAGFKVRNGGSYRGVDDIPLVTGYNFYMPGVEHIEKVSTTQEHLVWTDDKNEGDALDQSINIYCLGGAGFNINVGLNVHVIADKAPKMWLRWKTVDVHDIMKTWGRNMLRGVINEVSGTMSVDSVLTNFTVLEKIARDGIRDSLLAYGFALDGFYIISKPRAIDPKLETAINNKIIAKQDAETETMNIQKHNALSQQRASDARGDSSYNVIEALGKAEAIKALQNQLTPTYVEYIKWVNADKSVPRVPTYVGAGGFGFPLK